uniref:PID domain-containing protein n=1 Tax=Panagrolaimus davidi TaxID=227884 RepID=A0A914Q6G6_9BILA
MNKSDSSISKEVVTVGLQWIHPPSALIQGRVNYGVKMMGFTEVGATAGTPVIRDAIIAIKYFNENSAYPQKPIKVELSINVSEVQISDAKTKKILHLHPLRKISFCADDKEDRRIFAYIATDDSQKHICYVFSTNNIAKQIASTIGQAFDLAFQEHYVKETTKYKPSEETNALKARIQKLESENEVLKIENEYYHRKFGAISKALSPPPIPKTPIPKPPSEFSLPGYGNPFAFPSSNSPPPLDRAPSLEYQKSSSGSSVSAFVYPISPPIGSDFDCHGKRNETKHEISGEIDVSFNSDNEVKMKKAGGDILTVKNNENCCLLDLKLLMHQISRNDKNPKSDAADAKDYDAKRSPSFETKTTYDGNKNDQSKKEDDSDDDYMIPRYKLASTPK